MGNKLLEYFNNDELAANVWLSKYAQEGEDTPDDMHRRMAKRFASIEDKYQFERSSRSDRATLHGKLSEYGRVRIDLTEESIYEFFKDFKYIIPQGSIMSQLGAKSIGSLSNCFVIGEPEDSYGGIFQKDEEMAQLMKRRGGVGLDLSTLRPAGVATSNAAKSSTGPVSFMPRFSGTTREVAQDGRRGALMLSIDIKHPDSLNFIRVKRDLTQVTGANISVKLGNDFMEAVVKDDFFDLRFPCNVEPSQADSFKPIKAKEYWDEIIHSAHSMAEPGILFWDNITGYSPDGVYPQFKQVTTNPCGEIPMQPYDACRLIVVNLFSFVVNPFTEEAYFDFDHYYRVNYEAMRLSDDLIDLELEHIGRILDKIKNDPEPYPVKEKEWDLWLKVYNTAKASRRTGLGFTALADTFAALGEKYDSQSALLTMRDIGITKMESELDCTTDLAILRGTFEGWDKDLEFDLIASNEFIGNNDFYKMLVEKFPEQVSKMYDYGRRNASWSTIAPAGTTSLMTQTSSGIEPIFLVDYKRRKKVNPNDEDSRVDFTDQNGDTWQEFNVLHPKFENWYVVATHSQHCPELAIKILRGATTEQLEEIKKLSPWYGSTANDIDWIERVEMQSVIQKYITHSISSTINLPNNVTEEVVSKIYLESWKKGLKGITVYRDGSRSGVLVSNDVKAETFEYRDAPKRPKELNAEVHFVTRKGNKFTVIVGLYDGKPYEVFITENHLEIDKDNQVVKKKRGLYETKEGCAITTYEDVEVETVTRLLSVSLRHGANIKFVVEQLNKISGDMFSFSKVIARVLKKYIPDGSKSTVTCNDCKSENVVFEEGCNKCLDCGSSACG
jgi:ribonucleoside-diphosphate reductase alpha chain